MLPTFSSLTLQTKKCGNVLKYLSIRRHKTIFLVLVQPSNILLFCWLVRRLRDIGLGPIYRYMEQKPVVGQVLLIIEASRSHSVRQSHSVGLLWTSDQPDTDLYLVKHNTHRRQTDIHASGGIRTRNPAMLVAEDPRLRPRGHWDPGTLNNQALIIPLC